MGFLEKLDTLMKARSLNKNTLSAKSGIAYSTIDSLYKKGYDNMKLPTLKKLADFLGVSMEYLTNDDWTTDKVIKKSDFDINRVSVNAQYIACLYDLADDDARTIVDLALKPFEKKLNRARPDNEFAEEIVDEAVREYRSKVEHEQILEKSKKMSEVFPDTGLKNA